MNQQLLYLFLINEYIFHQDLVLLLEIEKQKKVILELFKLFKCSSTNANLKEFDLSDRIGRLSGINIKDGYIITKSTTGLKEFKYKI